MKLTKPPADLLFTITEAIQNDNPHVIELTNNINQFYVEQIQSDDMSEERDLCVELFKEYLKSDGIKKQIESQGIGIHNLTVFGSFATQCASKSSDLDLCVCASFEGKKKPLPVTVLQAIHRDLGHNPESKKCFGSKRIHDLSFVKTAKVPIIRFKMDNVAVDLSATFDKTPPRTSLAAKYINAYCQLDDRFKVLVTFLKHWLKSETNTTTHLRDFPNSYSLILMLIHVLQWYDIFPNLHQTHKEIFNKKHFKLWSLADVGHEFKFPLDENTLELHRRKHTKDLTVVQLLYLFACQYSEETIMMFYRFNMKSGDVEQRSPREQPITIVDAYDTRNPGRTALSALGLMGALKSTVQLLVNPEREMFASLMRITNEKTYLYPVNRFPTANPLNDIIGANLRQPYAPPQNRKHRQQNYMAQPQQLPLRERSNYQQPQYNFHMPPPAMAPPPLIHYQYGANQFYAFGAYHNQQLQQYFNEDEIYGFPLRNFHI